MLLAVTFCAGRGRRSRIEVPESIPPYALASMSSSELELQYWCLPPPLTRQVSVADLTRVAFVARNRGF